MEKQKTENKEETYKLYCSICGEKTKFKIVLIARRSGVKLECLKCGGTIHKNIKYLQSKKSGN